MLIDYLDMDMITPQFILFKESILPSVEFMIQIIDIRIFLPDTITHPTTNFTSGLAKPLLKLGYGRVITPHRKLYTL